MGYVGYAKKIPRSESRAKGLARLLGRAYNATPDPPLCEVLGFWRPLRAKTTCAAVARY